MTGPHIERLEASRAAYADLRPQVIAAGPWPLAERFGTEPEASWGPPEVLAHVSEMLPYWLGELERVLDGATEPVPFGRIAADPVRIGIIGRDRTLPLSVLFERIDLGLIAWTSRLEALPPDALRRRGAHPTLGEVTVERLAENFVVGHAEDHVEQLRAGLAAPRG